MFAIIFGIVIMNLLIALTIKTIKELIIDGGMIQSKKKLKSVKECDGFVKFVKKYLPNRFRDFSDCKKVSKLQ